MASEFWDWLNQLLAGKGSGGVVSIEEHRQALEALALPAIHIVATERVRVSRLGGLPDLSSDVPWPQWNGRPLAFLCQLDLSELPADCRGFGLPDAGVLLFFYDQEQDAWGFDPKDRGAWRVLYVTSRATQRSAPDGLQEDCIYPELPVAFSRVATYPDTQDERVDALGMSDAEADAYCAFRELVSGGTPSHRLLGHPDPVQNLDMDLEAQLASNGLYCGDSSGFDDPRAGELGAHRGDWLLLLQLDTDDQAGMMWGDAGMLYFWIRKQDLAARNFADCWMIFQCG